MRGARKFHVAAQKAQKKRNTGWKTARFGGEVLTSFLNQNRKIYNKMRTIEKVEASLRKPLTNVEKEQVLFPFREELMKSISKRDWALDKLLRQVAVAVCNEGEIDTVKMLTIQHNWKPIVWISAYPRKAKSGRLYKEDIEGLMNYGKEKELNVKEFVFRGPHF